ncbi:hypothetical protein CR513_57169, partial [Mucuna pruriens]
MVIHDVLLKNQGHKPSKYTLKFMKLSLLCQLEMYITKEAIAFCTWYMSLVEFEGVPKSHHEGRCGGNGRRDVIVKSMGWEQVLQERLYVLNNTKEVQPCLYAHQHMLKKKNP